MKTDALQALVREAAVTLPKAVIWPNQLGFDTRGADGALYEVWGPATRNGIPMLWGARREAPDGTLTWGLGGHPWQALTDAVNPCR